MLVVSSVKGADLVFDLVVFIISSNPNAIAMKASRANQAKTATEYTRELLINVVAGKKPIFFFF